ERRLRRARLHYGHGTDNPRDEAAYLVLRGLGLPFETDLRLKIGRSGQKRIESLVGKRIARRVPVAYLLHEAWLAGLAFYVDRRVVVPRSHLAELLGDRLRPWMRRPTRRVLDLCTGSGCLAILAAARAYLTPDGVLACEVGATRPAVERAYPRLAFTWPAAGPAAGGVFLIERAQLPADLE